MFVQIKNIKLIFNTKMNYSEPIGAEVDYNLILNNITTPAIYTDGDTIVELPEDELNGKILIMNGPNVNILNMQLWEYNTYIFKKVMASI